jgi:integrase/recombinase XerD
MKNINHSFTGNNNPNPNHQTCTGRASATVASPPNAGGKQRPKAPIPTTIRTTGREYANPVDYRHPYESMARLADFLALRYDANRTRHAYYRQVRLMHEHIGCDPARITEAQLRDYFLHVKLKKHWKPKTIRQAVASAKMCFVDLLGRSDWTVFSQIRTKDHDTLPAVLTRQQVHDLLAHIRLRRYRTPLKLIYCCGLRLSECLALTIHDIRGKENKLLIRNSKGHQDRVLPLPTSMYEELRRYWAVHKHPLLIFPNVGRGDNNLPALAKRMHTRSVEVELEAGGFRGGGVGAAHDLAGGTATTPINGGFGSELAGHGQFPMRRKFKRPQSGKEQEWKQNFPAKMHHEIVLFTNRKSPPRNFKRFRPNQH